MAKKKTTGVAAFTPAQMGMAAIGLGVLFALVNSSGGGGTGTPGADGGAQTPSNPGNPSTPGNSGSSSTTNQPPKPAPKPATPVSPVPAEKLPSGIVQAGQFFPAGTPLKYVFVDSWNGQTIYENVQSYAATLFKPFPGIGAIVLVKNKHFVGYQTGRVFNGYIELYKMIAGKAYNYWIDAKEVKIVNGTANQQMLRDKTGLLMNDQELKAIVKYF